MASIWHQERGVSGPGTRMARGLSGKAACEHLARLARSWETSGPKRTSSAGEALTVFLYERKALVASLYIEPMSPPSAPEKGQPKREAA